MENGKHHPINVEYWRHLTTDSLTTIKQNVHSMEPKIAWSRTRKNLFFKCPRAWYIRYGNNRSTKQKASVSFQRPWDLMLRAIKETLLDRLDDLSEGKEWSSLLTEMQLKFALDKHIEDSVHHVPNNTKESLLMYAKNRFALLWRTRLLKQLQERKHAQWYVLDRTEAIAYGTRKLFVSPDLAIRIQSKWHLVRFDMQKSPKRVHDELEANAMVLWALNHEGFNGPIASYRLHTIGWREGFWQCTVYQPDSSAVQRCHQLLEHDYKAMEEMSRYGKRNIALLPLAQNERTCSSCFHRKFCHGGENLSAAKYEQGLLELSARSTKARNQIS